MNKKIILASKSPRRKQLLEEVNIPFTIISREVEEYYDESLPKEKAIEQIAYQKASAVAKEYPDAIVIGADTMVCLDEHRLGKPKNQKEARTMLELLKGKHHEVVSGVCILAGNEKILFSEVTKVYFYDFDDDLLELYLESGESLDKAGGYGIQGLGKLLVEKIDGDYFNVVGLPVARVYRELHK